MDGFLIILTAIMVSTACGLLGNFLMLRKMAMMGDAISHAVLPGIVIAFLIAGSRDSVWTVVAAASAGLFATIIIEFLVSKVKLQTDASIGVTFTALFALGIILISVFAGQVDLDQDCILYGEIAYVPIDLWITSSGTIMGPRVLYTTTFSMIIVVAFVVLFYKELNVSTFDPEFSKVSGIRTRLVHYLLMGLVSLVTVTSFEAVGAILVVAFMIAAPATAFLLTQNLQKMLIISVLIGAINATLGYFMAVWLDVSIAGAMASVAGISFSISFMISPQTNILLHSKLLSSTKLETGEKP